MNCPKCDLVNRITADASNANKAARVPVYSVEECQLMIRVTGHMLDIYRGWEAKAKAAVPEVSA